MSPSIEKLFIKSFPENERRPLDWFRELIVSEPCMHLVAYDAKACPVATPEADECAMLCYWDFDTFIYVEYLAVDPSLRGKGIGRRIMEQLILDCNQPVILEVEPPTDPLTTRRIGFYHRLGFQLLPNPYLQPSYGVMPGIPLQLMLHSNNSSTPPPPVSKMVQIIHRHVYGQNVEE